MTLLRPLLVSLAAVSLIALSAAGPASADTTLASETPAVAKALFPTRVAFLASDHVRAYGSVTVIRGQVLTDHGAGEGSIPATVDLLRRYKGSTDWVHIRTTDTTSDATAPRFTFEVRTNANAFYRVVYAGDAEHSPSSATTQVWAYRTISTQIKPRLLQVYGKVAPNYAGKRLFVERKTCAACTWVRMWSKVVGPKSNYKVTLRAPAHGRWFWRLSTPATTRFIVSHSSVVTTSRS
jgi:hypothetical protein